MRTSLRIGGFLVSAVIVLAGCGGGTGHFAPTGDGGPVNPPGDDIAPGDDVAPPPGDDIAPGDDIGPSEDGGPIDPRCASGSPIGTGFACGSPGLSCPLGTVTDCQGTMQTLECSCDGKQWSCDPVPVQSKCVPPPVPCPDPSALYQGSACGLVGQECYSTVIPPFSCGGGIPIPPMSGNCTCTTDGWSCPVATPACPPPPMCPDPYTVYAFTYCNNQYGVTCPGNPQTCGSQVFYDAFQCSGNSWVSVAATACDIAGFDGGEGDAPFFIEGGRPPEND